VRLFLKEEVTRGHSRKGEEREGGVGGALVLGFFRIRTKIRGKA